MVVLAMLASPAYGEDPVHPLQAPADPIAVPGGTGDTLVDQLFKVVSEIAQNPFSDNTVAMGAIWFLASRISKFTKSVAGIPAAWQNRKVLLAEIKQAELEYEGLRAVYLGYEPRLAELVSESSELKKQLKALKESGNFGSEAIRAQLDVVEREMEVIREKVPFIQATEALRSLRMADNEIRKHLSDFEKMMAAYSEEAKKKGHTQIVKWAEEGRTASRLTKRHYRPDYLGEWLTTKPGLLFLSTQQGRDWKTELDSRKDSAAKAVQHFVDVHNQQVVAYNQGLEPGEKPLQRIAFRETEHGRPTNHFVLVPENPSQRADAVDRRSVPQRVWDNCQLDLGRLATKIDAKKLLRKNAYNDQIYNLKMLGAAGLTYYVFDKSFQFRHGISFLEAKARSKRNDKIAENRLLDIAAQLDEEKKGLNRLAPFNTAAIEAIFTQEPKIEERLKSRFNFRSETSGKKQALEERTAKALLDKEAELQRIGASFDEAMKKVLKNSTWTTANTVIANLYTDDQAKRDTTVKRNITLILRETIANLYPDIADEGALDQIEMTIIPDIVNELSEKLKKIVEEKKKTAAIFPDTLNQALAVAPLGWSAPTDIPGSAGSLATHSGLVKAP